jgi:hypothetical protein
LTVLLICAMVLAGCGPAQPAAPATAEAADGNGAAAVLEAYRAFGGELVTLGDANPSVSVDVVDLTGTIAAYELTGGDPPCSGFIRQAPSLVFTLESAQPGVRIAFTGNQPANLVIVEEGEQITCPPLAETAAQPEYTLEQPAAGRYGVWIGRVDMQEPVEGTLTAAIVE